MAINPPPPEAPPALTERPAGADGEEGAPWGLTRATLPPPPDDGPGWAQLPGHLPPVLDVHVHLFPDRLAQAVWRWFDAHAWTVRYPLPSEEVTRFLFERGVRRVVGLLYAHRAGMARDLNRYMARQVERDPRVIGFGTVFPGEPGAGEILREAFALGLSGVKLHCHVQCFAPDAPELTGIYEVCAAAGRPVLVHAGREPAFPEYGCDPYRLCSAERIARVLRAFPTLKLVVPHLGAGEFRAYQRLLERHDNLWLDTTMALAGYFPVHPHRGLLECRPERILYGSDFPNVPYAWDRELRALEALGLGEEALAALVGGNAASLLGVELT